MEQLTMTISNDEIVPQLDASYGSSWWDHVRGEAGQYNPNDRALVAALAGNVNVTNTDGGVTWELDGETVFKSTQELMTLFDAWQVMPEGGVQYRQDVLDATRGAAEAARYRRSMRNDANGNYTPSDHIAVDFAPTE